MSVDLSTGIVVCPFSLFISFSLFSIFFYFFGGLSGSFYLTLICPLWDLLICPLLGSFILSTVGSFPHLRATLYILQEYKEDLHTLQEVLNIKKTEKLSLFMQMYASPSVAGYAIILARHASIMRARPN